MPSQHLLVQIQQRKHQNNVRNQFEINIKDPRTTPDVVLASLLLTLNKF